MPCSVFPVLRRFLSKSKTNNNDGLGELYLMMPLAYSDGHRQGFDMKRVSVAQAFAPIGSQTALLSWFSMQLCLAWP